MDNRYAVWTVYWEYRGEPLPAQIEPLNDSAEIKVDVSTEEEADKIDDKFTERLVLLNESPYQPFEFTNLGYRWVEVDDATD